MNKYYLKISLILLIIPVLLYTSCSGDSEQIKYVRYSFELTPVKSGEKWGFINSDGEIKINPQFTDARVFADNRSAVKTKDDKWGFIDTNGTYIINPMYKSVSDFNEGIAVVARPNAKPEFIDTAGNVLCMINDALYAETVFEGLAKFVSKEDNKSGFVDKTGKIVITPQFLFAARFKEGLCSIQQVVNDKDTLFGFIDKKGKIVINPQFEWAGSFADSLAMIRIDEKYGYINKKGKIVINPQFDSAEDFNEGFAAVKMGEQWGFINKSGKIVINPQFEYAHSFKNSLASVQLSEDKWGYIDTLGKYKINPQFKAAGTFNNTALAPIKSGDKIGFIDSAGVYVVNPQYEECNQFCFGDIFFEHIEYNGVYSDFLDIDEFISKLFDKSMRSIVDFKPGMSLAEVKEKHILDEFEKENNQLVYTLSKPIELFGGIKIFSLTYYFDSDVTKRERYLVGSDRWYNYYDYRYVDNHNARTNGIFAFVNLGNGLGKHREQELSEKLIEQLEKKFNVHGTEEKNLNGDIKGRMIETEDMYYSIRWSDENVVAVILNKK